MSSQVMPGASVASKTGQSVHILLVGLVDSKPMHERLLHACRGICGKVENALLHRECVYKLSAPAPGVAPPKVSYELRWRLGKTASADSEKFVQPMSLVCLGDSMVFPPHAIKYLKEDDPRKTIQKPALRKFVEVEVGPTCDEVLKLMGFEQDFVFIRSGQMFTTGADNRTSLIISELHKQVQQQPVGQTPKLETDRKRNPVDDIWMVELMTLSETDSSAAVDSAIKEIVLMAEKLSPYVTLNSPEDGQNLFK